MRRWSNFGQFTPAPKKAPPAHGIKVSKAGTTWWGQHWIDALVQVLQGDSRRLARGRTYARGARTHDLVIKGGQVKAKVTGSAPAPYVVTIQLAQLGDAAWKKAIAAMAEKAQFAAELLAGVMPKEIDEIFQAGKSSLFPVIRADLVTNCTCPDWGDPCKHVAATHYVLGEALDGDPFLLFELRGRTKQQVLDALRLARGGEVRTRATKATEVAGVALGKLTSESYDASPRPLPAMQFAFDEPVSHGATLRQLGAPPSWTFASDPADTFAPLVRAAATAARRLATEEAPPIAPDPEAPRRPRARRVR